MDLNRISAGVSSKLVTMSRLGRGAFGALLVHRQAPIYEDFSQLGRFGDPALVKLAIEFAIDVARGGHPESMVLSDAMQRCFGAAPRPGEWGTYQATAAQEAISVVYHVLKYCRDHVVEDMQRAAATAIFNADYVDEYSQPRERRFETVASPYVPRRPLAMLEIRRQERDADLLTNPERSERARIDAVLETMTNSERIDSSS